ncbi:MAG TPA: DEAD/DEAH box helicase [Chloroflexota bacterium]
MTEIRARGRPVEEIAQEFRTDPRIASDVAAYREIPARQPVYAETPEGLDSRLVATMRRRGIDRLYGHQADTISAVLEGKNAVVVTPTASGKTLCYNLPVIDAILRDDQARALYLFPTKALSQDQMSELHSLVNVLDAEIKTFTYDGDTPQVARRAIREAGHIVVTNPDMLHTGILPHHTRWVRLFENLRYVVIDEMHVYRGVFGSHVANVIRRLKRICRYYGSEPQFICCSATIANPDELARRLVEEDLVLIDNNGAPSGKKHVFLINPPIVNRQLNLRQSSRLVARDLAARCVDADVQTIVFARSRSTVEVLLGYLRDTVHPRRRESIHGYRSGYLPLQRRAIEHGLRDGTVRAVVATNALELGIDIGALDACIIVGFPGTIASAWQQIGRAGRRSDSSMAVLVGNSGPLDQFLMTHSDYFFGRSPEAGLVDPDNLIILASHVKCAAFELPFQAEEQLGTAAIGPILQFLEEHDILHESDGVWHWMSESFPAEDVSLRTAAADNVVIIDQGPPARVIGEIDRVSAPTMVHEEAIYMHQSRQYQVEKLDLEEKKAYVRAVDVDYYTDAEQAVKVAVLEAFEESARKGYGEVAVSYLPTIYKKIKLHTHENVGWGRIHLEEDTFHTSAYWITVPSAVAGSMPVSQMEIALVGLAHVLREVAPLFLMCDPHDVSVWPEVKATHTGSPTIFLYDRVPGGVGFSRRLFTLHQRLLASAGDVVTSCRCERGCPSCIGPLEDRRLNPKLCVLQMLAVLFDKPDVVGAGAS